MSEWLPTGFEALRPEPWVLATLAAVMFQTARFAVQKQLTVTGMSALAATWARFLWATPFLLTGFLVWLVATGTRPPDLSRAFWMSILIGSVAQILATVCVLLLFKKRAFAIGLTFKKSEALQTGLLGWLVLDDRLSLGGAVALFVGFIALGILSSQKGAGSLRDGVRSAGLGLASGAFFAITGVFFRAAILEIDAPTGVQAAFALVVSTTLQTLLLAIWFLLRDPVQVCTTVAAWRPGIALGAVSLSGSYCWFAAFALQNAAYVYALGQLELVIALAIGFLFFGERPQRRELLGMGLLVASLIALVVFA